MCRNRYNNASTFVPSSTSSAVTATQGSSRQIFKTSQKSKSVDGTQETSREALLSRGSSTNSFSAEVVEPNRETIRRSSCNGLLMHSRDHNQRKAFGDLQGKIYTSNFSSGGAPSHSDKLEGKCLPVLKSEKYCSPVVQGIGSSPASLRQRLRKDIQGAHWRLNCQQEPRVGDGWYPYLDDQLPPGVSIYLFFCNMKDPKLACLDCGFQTKRPHSEIEAVHHQRNEHHSHNAP